MHNATTSHLTNIIDPILSCPSLRRLSETSLCCSSTTSSPALRHWWLNILHKVPLSLINSGKAFDHFPNDVRSWIVVFCTLVSDFPPRQILLPPKSTSSAWQTRWAGLAAAVSTQQAAWVACTTMAVLARGQVFCQRLWYGPMSCSWLPLSDTFTRQVWLAGHWIPPRYSSSTKPGIAHTL